MADTMSEVKKYYMTGKCQCGKTIATASKRCRRCQGKRRTALNDEKRRLKAGL